MTTLNYNGQILTVNAAQAERLIARGARPAVKPADVVKQSLTDVCDDSWIATNAMGRVTGLAAAKAAVVTTQYVSEKALALATVCNNKAVKLAEDIMARSKATVVVA